MGLFDKMKEQFKREIKRNNAAMIGFVADSVPSIGGSNEVSLPDKSNVMVSNQSINYNQPANESSQ